MGYSIGPVMAVGAGDRFKSAPQRALRVGIRGVVAQQHNRQLGMRSVYSRVDGGVCMRAAVDSGST